MAISFAYLNNPSEVKFNGNDISKVVYNGNVVWEKTKLYTLTISVIETTNIHGTEFPYWIKILSSDGGVLLDESSTGIEHNINVAEGTEITIILDTLRTDCNKYRNLVYNLPGDSLNYNFGNSSFNMNGIDNGGLYGTPRSDTITYTNTSHVTINSDMTIKPTDTLLFKRAIYIYADQDSYGTSPITNARLGYRVDPINGGDGVTRYISVNDVRTEYWFFMAETRIQRFSWSFDLDQSSYYVYSSLTNQYLTRDDLVNSGGAGVSGDTYELYLKSYSYQYMTLTNNGRTDGTYSITVYNPNNVDLYFIYNTLMAFDGNFQNWDGLNDTTSVLVSANSSRNISISENMFATTLGGGFTVGGVRWVTYANGLDPAGGGINPNYTKVTA